jgi:hypothetical protein
MHKLAIAAAAAAVVGAAATSTAYAGSQLNGPALTGIALQAFEASQPVVITVNLPSGKAVELRKQATR